MPIITDPKKLSMPQQVQKNKEDIEDIREIIDGLDGEDNVVVVDDISQILTAEELKSIKQPVAFIVYNNHLYFKRSETSAIAYFDVVFSISVSTVITFESSEIQIQLSNGALSIVNSPVSTYSETQIDNKLSLKADIAYVDNNFASLSGANFIGAITAPSIIQNMSDEYRFDPQTIATGYNREFIYGGISQTGNKLTIVIFGSITRTSDTPGDTYITFTRAHLPHSIMQKIYPYVISGATIVSSVNLALFTTYSSSISKVCACTKLEANDQLAWSIYGLHTIEKDTPHFFRIEQTFLLSDNLAL